MSVRLQTQLMLMVMLCCTMMTAFAVGTDVCPHACALKAKPQA